MNETDILLMPAPKKMDLTGGWHELPQSGYIVLQCDRPWELMTAARRLRWVSGRDWKITASGAGDPAENVVVLVCDPALEAPDEDYQLEISDAAVTIRASSPEGAFYGACTLCQLLTQFGDTLPTLNIHDWPVFPVRGVMLDISRDKVPTLRTLMDLVDMLAGWKINHLQLYTEHTFAYREHPQVWEHASPMTGEDILELDRYCAERFIELTPNQNSFGHMERWLRHDRYRRLAEAPDGFDCSWGHWDNPFSICPGDPGSLELLRGLYDELLPHFSSKLFNVGLDETIDLGQGRSRQACEELGAGRVYLDFLLAVHGEVSKRGSRMLFWGDIIMHHLELIPELPADAIALEWGYEADHPFREDGEKFLQGRIPFWVCPGTSSWNTTGGRTNNAIANLANAAANGLAAGAVGFLNTDWGDGGHWHYLPVSYLGLLYGAAVSWNLSSDVHRLPRALSLHAFGDESGEAGQVAFDLGNLHELTGKKPHNTTVLRQQFGSPMDNLAIIEGVEPEAFARVLEEADRLKTRIDSLRMDRPDGELIRRELANMLRMSAVGARLGLIRLGKRDGGDVSGIRRQALNELRELLAEHQRLWAERNRPGGLSDSLGHVRPRVSELETQQ